MDVDIEFGEVEETPPEVRLRPDRNKHFAVAAVQSPSDNELPIFVDLDVMRDMEAHAQSDTSVELGGVLLGGQHHDEDGRPFVVITDSLRAQHFEATKGSFKFTHDTWSQISRERDEFPEDLQMVGWYHTHPDWGVFLSGMDMFICDNFFNKPLDVALVIDPCRGDRGMFQWTGNPRQRIRRTDGFYLMASRFRQEELEFHAATFEGNDAMPPERRYSGMPGMSAPVVNIAEQRQAPWQMVAVMGMLTMQFLLVGLLAWKIIDPLAKPAESPAEKQLTELEEKFERLAQANDEAAQVEAQMRVLDRVVGGLRGQPGDLMSSLEDLERAKGDLTDQVSSLRQSERQYKTDLAHSQAETKKAEQVAEARQKEIDRQQTRIADLRADVAKLKDELREYRPETDEEGDSEKPWWKQNWVVWAGAGMLAAALLIFGAVWSVNARRMLEEQDRERGREHSSHPPTENEGEETNNS